MHVLVVEDDPIQRMATVELLVEAGHQVVDAENADIAMQIIRSGWQGTVVVTDVHMPRSLNGFELAQAICEKWPAIGVVIVCGVFQPEPGDLPVDSRFLAKPFEPSRLTKLVEEIANTSGRCDH